MKHRIILLAIAATAAFETAAARPTVVNIVVGSMRAEDLGRYADNATAGSGACWTGARSSPIAATTTSRPRRPVSLATLTTGAMPSRRTA